MSASLTRGALILRLDDTWYKYVARPSKVAAGQADGIQPRTIEVLQVGLICRGMAVERLNET